MLPSEGGTLTERLGSHCNAALLRRHLPLWRCRDRKSSPLQGFRCIFSFRTARQIQRKTMTKTSESFRLDTKYLKHPCFPTLDFHFGELTTQRPSAIGPASPGCHKFIYLQPFLTVINGELSKHREMAY